MLMTILQVAVGGAIGSVARYLSGVAVMRSLGPHDFPLGVIFVGMLSGVGGGIIRDLIANHVNVKKIVDSL